MQNIILEYLQDENISACLTNGDTKKPDRERYVKEFTKKGLNLK